MWISLLVLLVTSGSGFARQDNSAEAQQAGRQPPRQRQEGRGGNQPAAADNPTALAREYVALRQRMRQLDDRIDALQAELRLRRRDAKRELENSPEIEQARLDLRDARHDYYKARDRVVNELKQNEEFVQARRRVAELDEQIAALRPKQDAEFTRSAGRDAPDARARDADAVTASATIGGGEAGEGANARPPAGDTKTGSGSTQDQIFELAPKKLRAADHAGSIEAEALRADPEVRQAWDAYSTASERLKALQSGIDRQLEEHDRLAEIRDELNDLREEYETLEVEARAARAAYESATDREERQRRHERDLKDDEFNPLNPVDRYNWELRRRLLRGPR